MKKSLKELRQELADYKRRMREDECDIGMMVSIVAHLREQRESEFKNLQNHLRAQGYNDYEMGCIAKGDSESADARMQETYPKLEKKIERLEAQKWALEMKMGRIHDLVNELNKGADV